MDYRAPGLLTGASESVLAAWNELISDILAKQLESMPGAAPFIVAHSSIGSAPVSLHWPANPAEPRFCLDDEWARKLSDWGVRGRHAFHNEYCEYAMVTSIDSAGKLRLKRFTATTELAEWWTTAATHDPDYLKAMAEEVLRRSVSFSELYGLQGNDPLALSETERRLFFARNVAGHGQHQDLIDAGIPADPEGDINRSNALFMAHQINGLDDLIYIVLFGAQPYVVQEGEGWRRARLHEIFVAQNTAQLACRNADPAAAQGAYDTVLKQVNADRSQARGCKLAFADPVGMYIQSFQDAALYHNGNPVPAHWTTFSRGVAGLYQRLEFGPSDDEDAYLDDVVHRDGGAEIPIAGGYQLARLIEVGPRVLVGPEEDIRPEWSEIPPAGSLDCSVAKVCNVRVEPLRQQYEDEHQPIALRGI